MRFCRSESASIYMPFLKPRGVVRTHVVRQCTLSFTKHCMHAAQCATDMGPKGKFSKFRRHGTIKTCVEFGLMVRSLTVLAVTVTIKFYGIVSSCLDLSGSALFIWSLEPQLLEFPGVRRQVSSHLKFVAIDVFLGALCQYSLPKLLLRPL